MLNKDDTYGKIKVRKRSKVVPNYMKASAAWLSKDGKKEDGHAQEELLKTLEKRQS